MIPSKRLIDLSNKLVKKHGMIVQVFKCLEEMQELKEVLEMYASWDNDAASFEIGCELADVFITCFHIIGLVGPENFMECLEKKIEKAESYL